MSSGRVNFKAEPQEQPSSAAASSTAPRRRRAPLPLVHGLPPMDLDSSDDDNDDVMLEDKKDEIIREIDVFLSPELSRQLYLVQFPLQRLSQQIPRSKPQAARIKPRHCMVELEYPTRPGNDDDQQDYSGQFFLPARTFASQTIPVSTHMALGKLIVDDSEGAPGLHLVPLCRITQMRPSFHHVNEATLQMSSTTDDDPEQDGGNRRPLNFQKKESDRANLARKSSYAYKKASEDSEIWIPLEVHAESSEEWERNMEKVTCTAPNQNLLLGRPGTTAENALTVDTTNDGDEPLSIPSNQNVTALGSSSTSTVISSATYVQSLNYLPHSMIESLKTQPGMLSIGDSSNPAGDIVSLVIGKMVQLMHQGWPMPYSVLRPQFDPATVSDDVLQQALNSCAFWVRGNFILQSRLLPLGPAIGQARTFVLFLFQSLGVVHRSRLLHVYEGDDQVTPEVILMLLEQVGKKTNEGWKLKVDDDKSFQEKYPRYVPLHIEFWRKQVRRYGPLLERYRQNTT